MARAVRRLHLAGLAHSDLSSKNILIDPPGRRCSVIDIDSLVVPGVYAPDVLGTPGYIAPEVLATQHMPLGDRNRRLPSNLTDLYALAVLIYEYLLRRHPLRGPKVNGKTAEEDELMSMGEKALYIEHPKVIASNRHCRSWPCRCASWDRICRSCFSVPSWMACTIRRAPGRGAGRGGEKELRHARDRPADSLRQLLLRREVVSLQRKGNTALPLVQVGN